jgi:hypothetical protein
VTPRTRCPGQGPTRLHAAGRYTRSRCVRLCVLCGDCM